MIISIHEGSTCDRFGPEKGYAMLKRAGIDGIQFGMGHYLMPGKVVRAGGPSIMDEPLETIIEAVRPYKEAADKAGIVVSQVHAPFPVWVEYSEDINRRMIDITRKAIAVTEYMGSHQCIIHPAAPQENNKRLSDEEEWAINKAIYTALIPDLKQHHVMGLLENMFSRGDEGTRFASVCSDFYEAARWIDELNEIAGEELFGFCFDTGHCHLARDFRIRALHADGIVVNLPMKAVRAEARKQIHANGQAVAAEHAGKAALIGHDGAVKHAVGALIAVARDHRVAGIAPYGRLQALRPVLPGDIGQGAAKNVCHTSTLAFLHKYYGKCCIKLRPAKGIPSRAAIKNRPRPAGRAGDGSPACPPR